ncbi:MAG: CotH kinase family protein [Caldilineales bacterium]
MNAQIDRIVRGGLYSLISLLLALSAWLTGALAIAAQGATCTGGGTSPCRVYLPLISRPSYTPVSLPYGLNSGGEAVTLGDGRWLHADHARNGLDGGGYEGGEIVSTYYSFEPLENTEDDDVYRSARAGMAAYRFTVPNGLYLVELHMAEVRFHGPNQASFSVAIEGQPVIQNLDLYALAQHDYVVRYRFAAQVADGQLDITFSAPATQPLVSAIWIEAHRADQQAPAQPQGLEVLGGYAMALVSWDAATAADVAGYRVYRANSSAGPFLPVSDSLTPLTRYFDSAVTVGQPVCYAVMAIDVDGNSSPRSTPACATPVDHSVSTLPVLQLSLSLSNWFRLYSDPFTDNKVAADLTWQGVTYDATAQYRGRSTRASNKKGWRFEANVALPMWGSNVLLINGEGYDPTLLRDKIVYDLFEALGLQPQQAQFVHLALNGQFLGVLTAVENPDSAFLQRTGRDPLNDDVFKCDDGLDSDPNCVNQVVKGRNQQALYDFAAVVNRTAEHEFAATISDVFDVRSFLDYLALKTLIADQDFVHQYLLYHNAASKRWQMLPWDNNLSFGNSVQALDYGTAAHPSANAEINVLQTRLLAVPQYRRYYGERLQELMATLMTPQAVAARVETARQQIWFDAVRDIWKPTRENYAVMNASMMAMRTFAEQRNHFVQAALPAYMPTQSRFLSLNELMPYNSRTLPDPADRRYDPWFELVNAGLRAVDIGGTYLSDNRSEPTRFQIATGTQMAPLGTLLFWGDGQPQQGNQHTNFVLSANGGTLYWFDRDGSTLLDSITYPALSADVAWARFPDYSGQWFRFNQPTPEQSNRLLSPVISQVQQTPALPQAGDVVTVTARLADDGLISQASILYGTQGRPTTSATLYDDGLHGDGAANDGLYGGQIPAASNGTVVSYYLHVLDDYGRAGYDPFAAPVLLHRYRVGFQTSPVLITEFMADNENTIEDPDDPGEFPDWIEVTNVSTATVNLRNYSLTDNLQRPTKFRIMADILLNPGQSLLFWADDETTQGPTHTNFKLDKAGEAVGLFHPDSVTMLDSVVFPAQTGDVAYGRCPLNSDPWGYLFVPTPGWTNACGRVYLPLMAASMP